MYPRTEGRQVLFVVVVIVVVYCYCVCCYRFDVKDILNHEVFAEGEFKVEVVMEGPKGDITFRMEVPTKENKKDRQESVEFSYSLHSDIPENVVEEMVS